MTNYVSVHLILEKIIPHVTGVVSRELTASIYSEMELPENGGEMRWSISPGQAADLAFAALCRLANEEPYNENVIRRNLGNKYEAVTSEALLTVLNIQKRKK